MKYIRLKRNNRKLKNNSRSKLSERSVLIIAYIE